MYIPYILLFLAIWIVSLLAYSYKVFRDQFNIRVHGARAPPGFVTWLVHQFINARQFSRQTGAVNIGGVMMMGISMVFLAVGFIFLPISTDASADLLAYAYSSNGTITDATFTGYTAVVGITPLLILIGFLAAAVIAGMLGIKVMKGGSAAKADPGSLILCGLSIVFISIGLIIEPVMLDGVASVLHSGGAGISSTFTGYEAVIKVSPLLVHLAFLASAVISGFFGLKRLGSGTSSD
jgi:hypothetical protein